MPSIQIIILVLGPGTDLQLCLRDEVLMVAPEIALQLLFSKEVHYFT